MDRVYQSSVSGTPPAAPSVPLLGYPRAGDPISGTKATRPGPWWYHMITEELRNVIAAAGLTPDATDTAQVLEALQALFMPAAGVLRVWQNVLASRAASTAYQNTTGREIFVAIRGDVSSGVGRPVEVSPNGTTWIEVGATGQVDDSEGCSFPVPADWYYRVNGTATFNSWAELS